MTTPLNPWREVAEAQLAQIQTIVGGADWYTDIGTRATLAPTWPDDPPNAVIYLAACESNSTDQFGGVEIVLTWQAIIPVDIAEPLSELDVLADLNAALTCGQNTLTITGAVIQAREQGSKYSTVAVSTTVHRPTR